MCGVPVHRADDYLQRLIRTGYRVAVCEQIEDPAEASKRGAQSVVRRDVMRLVTPGTLTEDSAARCRARNYLAACLARGARAATDVRAVALASLDISTGEFEVGEVDGRRSRRRARAARRRAKCWSPDALLARRERRRAGARLRRGGDAACRRRLRQHRRRARAEGAASASPRSTASARSRAPSSPPPARCSPMSS